MDRYFRAFEMGTMPEDTCAPRLAALSEQAKALEARAGEPTFLIPAVRPPSGSMEPTRLNANRFASLAGGRMSLDEAD
jgi:hypothetical protein